MTFLLYSNSFISWDIKYDCKKQIVGTKNLARGLLMNMINDDLIGPDFKISL